MLPSPPPLGKSGDALVLNSEPITISAVVAVAHGRRVSVAPACLERLKEAREAMLLTLENGKPVYGVTTGVGALRGIKVDPAEAAHFNRLLILSHRVSHGDAVPRAVVRAAMLCRAQGLSLGGAGVRPAVIEALIDALNADEIPTVHAIGSVCQADLVPLAEIAEALIARGLDLQTREALALIGANSFSLGWAALALDRADRSNRALEAAAALTMEGVLCNPDAIDPAVYQAHPSSGLKQSVLRLRELLAGGALLTGEQLPRLLQDPLSLRVAPQVHGTTRDAWRHTVGVFETELASASDNPLLTPDGRLLSVGNFDASGLTIALDYMRLALAQTLTLSCERVQKLLSHEHSGLPTGLRASSELTEDALAIMGHREAALAAEARLLAQPVSLELPTSSIAESIEDRVSMAPLAARRLDEQAQIAMRLAAVELVCAAQAIDLRERSAALGTGTGALYRLVRSHLPALAAGDAPVADLTKLTAALERLLA